MVGESTAKRLQEKSLTQRKDGPFTLGQAREVRRDLVSPELGHEDGRCFSAAREQDWTYFSSRQGHEFLLLFLIKKTESHFQLRFK